MHEFEIITEKTANFKAFINVLKYRTPHIHSDYELGIILYGNMVLKADNAEIMLSKGDLMCLNPFQVHELYSSSNVPILLLQVNPAYFNRITTLMRNIEFTSCYVKKDNQNRLYNSVSEKMLEFARLYIDKKGNYTLRCAGLLNLLFCDLMELVPYKIASKQDQYTARTKADRMKRLADYIEKNYQEKIRLSDLAGLEHITDTHMSHFFTENFHMSFQDYLMKLRCEKARSLLLTTDLTLFDISFSCGFSDPKYLNKCFLKQYGCIPRNYRESFGKEKLEVQQNSMLTTQTILSDRTSLSLLGKYISC